MHLIFRNVNDAFRGMVDCFTTAPRANGVAMYRGETPIAKRNSRNGYTLTIEEPVTITYTHPKERVLFNQTRDANPFFHLYEALWMLAGRNDVAPLKYYVSKMADFSDDGTTFNGAYGYRWRSSWVPNRLNPHEDRPEKTDQIQIIINHLKNNPDSRRAVLQMWNVEDDLLKIEPPGTMSFKEEKHNPLVPIPGTVRHGSKDVCCNLSVMFSIREERYQVDSGGVTPWGESINLPDEVVKCLDITVTNRSNDCIWGALGTNYVHFSFLQEYIATHLGVEVGRYHQISNNLHVYDWNWKPEEWLGWYNGPEAPLFEYDGVVFENGGTREPTFVPLIEDKEFLETFERELPNFVEENYNGPKIRAGRYRRWSTPFLDLVAQRMCHAYSCYKQRDFEMALAWCEEIRADDWRIACQQWIQKRANKKDKDDASK